MSMRGEALTCGARVCKAGARVCKAGARENEAFKAGALKAGAS